MKKLKFSFAAIIAIVAIGLTIAAQAGAFEAKRVITACFEPGALQLKEEPACLSSNITVPTSTRCDQSLGIFEGWALIATGTSLTVPQRDDKCDEGTYFCCVTVIPGTACANQTPINLGEGSLNYIVDQVFCKSTQQ